jgi:hypothetical protein
MIATVERYQIKRVLHARRIAPTNSVWLEFVMGMIAYDSGELEGATWDQWELHRNALIEAYQLGQSGAPVTIYHFLKWHKAILPFGGSLRDTMPVSVGMGESFRPAPVHLLPARVNEFVREWTGRATSIHTLASLHFAQWRMHPFADGNKRHCRLMTVYGCGLLGIDPVCISLANKYEYIDALDAGNIDALTQLFSKRQFKI